FNEAINLPRCLDALAWCDDIAVVDSGSTDGTLDIARARNIRVLHNPFRDFADQRNFGLAEAGFLYPWLLHLDASGVVTAKYAEREANGLVNARRGKSIGFRELLSRDKVT